MKKTTKKLGRLKQLFERAILDAAFKEAVKRFRKKWKLPPRGMNIKNIDASLKWQRWLNDESDKYKQSEEFQNGFKQLKKILINIEKEKSKNPLEDQKTVDEEQDKLNAAIPLNAFHADLFELQMLANLSDAYKETIKEYVLYNTIGSIQTPYVQIHGNFKDPFKIELSIRIFPETAIEEVIEMWKTVKIHQRNLLGVQRKRIKNRPKLKRNERILELSKDNISDSDIAQLINEEFPGENLHYYNISKIRNKMKK